MAQVKTTLAAVLERIVARIVAQTLVTEFTDSTCYISLNPDVTPPPNPGDMFCVVSPASGQFNQTMLDGGGNAQARFDTEIVVTVHSITQLDEPGRDKVFLNDASRGVITRLTKVAKVLSCHDLLDGSGNRILSQPLLPSNLELAHDGRELGSAKMWFSCEFNWDFS